LKERKTFTERMTTRYLFNIHNEENLEMVGSTKLTVAKLIALFGLVFLLLAILSFLLVTTLLSRYFNPAHAYKELDRKLAYMSVSIDSLEEQIRSRDQMIASIQAIFSGEVPPDAYQITDSAEKVVNKSPDWDKVSQKDAAFRKEFESSDFSASSNDGKIGDIAFFTPINGMVIKRFSHKEQHYGLDILAKKDEPIKAVAEGTVVMASWTQDAGYVLGIQHRNNLLSFYKHNSTLNKSVGQFVKAGELVAIIGNSGEYTDGPHLHFELWHNGAPINPESLIKF